MWKWTKQKDIRAIILDSDSLPQEYMELKYEDIIPQINVYKVSSDRVENVFFYFDKNAMLQHVLKDAHCESYSVVAISSDYSFLKDMLSNHIGTVFVGVFSQDKLSQVPDFTCRSLTTLTKILKGDAYGYSAEVFSAGISNVTKALLSCKTDIESSSGKKKQINLYLGGRYYKTDNTYLLNDALSRTIIEFKKEYIKTVDDFFDSALLHLCKHEPIDLITYVPLKSIDIEKGKFDRFKSLQLPKLKKFGMSLINVIKCTENFEQKGLTAEARKIAVQGAFEVVENVNDKHVLVIDDIYSTGATVSEIAKVLYDHGAKSVSVLVLAVNQLIESSYLTYKYMKCPICQSNLVLRVNNNDKSLFFGCLNYTEHQDRPYTLNMQKGLELAKEVNKLDIVDVIDLDDSY